METGRLANLPPVGQLAGLRRARREASALWRLGVADLAAVLYLLDDTPVDVSCWGESYVRQGVGDVAFCFLRFATGVTAHLHLSSLDPQTLRRLTLVGSRQMVVFDELAERALTIYDRAVVSPRGPSFGRPLRVEGDGSVTSPGIPADDPLQLMCETFLASVRRGRPLEAEGEPGGTRGGRPGGAAALAGARRERRGRRRAGPPDPRPWSRSAAPEPGGPQPLRRGPDPPPGYPPRRNR